MSLTTQRPVPQGDIPELAPWYLDIYTPPPVIYKGAILREKALIPEEIPQGEEEQEYQKIPSPSRCFQVLLISFLMEDL